MSYYRFETLQDTIKKVHGIRAKERLDCLAYNSQTVYKGLTDFVNSKGQMYLYKIPAKQFVKSNCRRIAELSLTNGKLNLSSIYLEDVDYPEYGYGFPNANRVLSNGTLNPLFPYRFDCYLFIINSELSIIEILVIPNGRNMVEAHYRRLIDGELDSEIFELRDQAKPFFNYERAL